ncbi:4Fe-4S binding domain protein [Fibrobacter succinogenes subsp. succinogenes S85]|uniref:4Fe-4S binding domain protein n=1 Tax=Fibrobacter succinogenes (strain ATCC 19169 / S85) TaxID=59374 RepID=C9RMK9_FIBSS|nr:4Fe-4S dicluster domain-containing protein [Fibrobacter succinogenes]ACX76241.1 4Fe-4S ferredoxin iron-sulfur binding domain protein [Fibrobacter succinogenes subsp. succinogenes S85]ADL24578.1 4Fe-4S binding domain protein [Fibrobacter succinogenes subsp. succinogenes S85]
MKLERDSNCSSCAACANICARSAITMRLDDKGFYRPVIDTDKCIFCGTCEQVCPWTNVVSNPNECFNEPRTVAAFAKNDSIRLESSSGGIFTMYHPEMDDNKGTSVVLLNSNHGKTLFDSIADKIVQCESKLEYAIEGNPCIVRSSNPHPKRAEFFANLDKCSMDDLINKYSPYPSFPKRMYH